MSSTIEEAAQYAEERGRTLRRIAAAYPEARLEVLWDDGPAVPVIYTREALNTANRIHVGIVDKRPALFPYIEIGRGESRGRLYLMRSETRAEYVDDVIGAMVPRDLFEVMARVEK